MAIETGTPVSATATSDALDLLLDYERRLAASGARLPGREEVRERWTGIAFRLGDHTFVAPMEEVGEILDPPTCTRVPGTAPWFVGVANVRGTLLPVMDLHGLMVGGRSAAPRNARALVYSGEGVSAAFRVDDVLGLKRFYKEEMIDVEIDNEVLAPYIDGGFHQGDETWAIFSFARFAASRDFLEISR